MEAETTELVLGIVFLCAGIFTLRAFKKMRKDAYQRNRILFTGIILIAVSIKLLADYFIS